MRRFFINSQSIQPPLVTLTGQEAQHISRVLRMTVGDQVELFDGTGAIFRARLISVHKNRVCAEIENCEHEERSLSPYPLSLMQALLKGKKTDFVLQKATELGVEECILFRSRYCAAAEITPQQQERWQRIILESCKQCRRPVPMKLTLSPDLQAIPLDPFVYKFIAHEDERKTAGQLNLSAAAGAICIFIGPEGGWSNKETEYLLGMNCTPVSLGEFILRGETAAVAACSILKYLTRT